MKRIRRRRGAAMVEAVILLPVLAIVFIAIGYAHTHASARHAARASARRCAWAHALDGCDAVPVDCAPPAMHDRPTHAAADSLAVEIGGSGVLSDVPLLGAAVAGLLGTSTRASSSATVPTGTEARRFDVALRFACNPRPTSPWGAVRATFCGATRLCDG